MTMEEEFKAKVIQYCLDCGTGIEYKECNEDGSHNFTTEKEKSEKPSAKVRYVRPETIDWFLSPEIIKKTTYAIEKKDKGKHIDLINFDEWVAICNIFNCPEMTYEDALKINGILWNYDITPLEFDPKAMSPKTRFDRAMIVVCEECKKLEKNNNCELCGVELTKNVFLAANERNESHDD